MTQTPTTLHHDNHRQDVFIFFPHLNLSRPARSLVSYVHFTHSSSSLSSSTTNVPLLSSPPSSLICHPSPSRPPPVLLLTSGSLSLIFHHTYPHSSIVLFPPSAQSSLFIHPSFSFSFINGLPPAAYFLIPHLSSPSSPTPYRRQSHSSKVFIPFRPAVRLPSLLLSAPFIITAFHPSAFSSPRRTLTDIEAPYPLPPLPSRPNSCPSLSTPRTVSHSLKHWLLGCSRER